jgi:DNA-binding NarL/FixJ family response regulator
MRFVGVLGDKEAPQERLSRTVVIIDDRHLIVDALSALLEASGRFEVTSCATEEADAAAIASIAPDLVLVGVGEAQEHGLRLVEALHQFAPEIPTVIIADAQDPALIHCVLDQGVAALVLTAASADDLALTLDQVLRGQTALPAGWQNILASSDADPVACLSERQQEVLRLLAEGCTYDEIAARLVITVNTVKFHVRSIYLRLGVGNRMAAAKLLAAYEPHHVHLALSDDTHQNGWAALPTGVSHPARTGGA